jgi:replication factor A1
LEINMDAQQIQQITDRISQNLVSKGVSPDKHSISEKLTLYINEFGVVPFEAERKVLSDQYKQHKIPEEAKPAAGSSSGDLVHIADIQPNDWVSVEVKVVSLQAPNSPAIAQSGIFADSTGAVRFVVFSKASELPKLELEKWYRIDSAVVDSFKGVANLKLHSGSRVTEIEDDRCLVPSEPAKLNELKAGVVSCIHVKYIEEWESRSDRMMQSGLVADESGRMKFVLWQDPDKEKLIPGAVYNIFYASVDEYNGRLSLTLNSAVWIQDEDAEISVPVSAGSSAPKEPLPVSSIRDLSVGYASLRVKFVEEWESKSERMMQTGLVGDETGRIKFVLWQDESKERLELGRVYEIINAKVDEFNGRLSISLNPATYSAEEPTADIAVGTRMDEVSGTIVQVSKGSGLVRRCPVEGCNRVLSRQNFCPIHEIQNSFNYDLRIKGVVDNGQRAYNVLVNREVTEALSGMTMDQAIEIASNSPLGLEEIQSVLTERLCGRYVKCFGTDFDGRILVKSAEFIRLDPNVTAELMNRAGASAGGNGI